VFAPNHKLRSAVTALAIGNVGKRCDAATNSPWPKSIHGLWPPEKLRFSRELRSRHLIRELRQAVCPQPANGHAFGGHVARGDAPGDCRDSCDKPPSHDTSRIAWAKLMARVGEEFPFACPGCGGDIRLIAFITDPGPIRKVLTHLGEALEPPPVSPARGPPTDWGELVQVHDDRAIFQGRIDELPVIDIRSL
jgi:hypothetical protein